MQELTGKKMNAINSLIITTIFFLKYILYVITNANTSVVYSLRKLVCFCFVLWSYHSGAQNKVNENGYNVFYYPNGTILSEGTLRNGKPDNYWKTYHPNARLKSEGNRKNYELDSTWKFYNEEGILLEEINYAAGKKNGVTRKYTSKGVLESEETFVNNVRQGKARYFFPNGKVKEELSYADNLPAGKGTEYDSTGIIITQLEYAGGRVIEREEINRFNNEGKRTGKWVEFYGNGKIKNETNFVNGVKDGISSEYDERGNLKKLKQYDLGNENDTVDYLIFLDIRREYHPNGKVKFGGTYRNSKKHGVFREYNEQGEMINGYVYEDDFKIAEGIIDSSGKYIGKWKDFYKTGELRSQGEYDSTGVKINEWIYYYRNGKTEQKGKYSQGKPHGKWLWFYKNGAIQRDEMYRYGKENGEVTEYDSLNTVISRGMYVSGNREGEWFYDLGDHIEKGAFTANERDGVWEYTYKEGNKRAFKGGYVNGLAEGKHKYFYPSGRLAIEGKYKSGLKEGRWVRYDEKGMVMFTITYRRGVEVEYDGQRIKTHLIPGDINSVFD